MPRKLLPNAAPKPKPAPPAKPQYSSIVDRRTHSEKIAASQRLRSTTPLNKFNPEKRAKREKRNQDYYKSAEWRAKRQAVFARDGFQCVELNVVQPNTCYPVEMGVTITDRCPTRGEVVNGKQTSRGLVCEEVSYGHRGIPGRIDTCKTRCKEHDRALTPIERANHSQGFHGGHPRVMAGKP